jgi:5-methylcytosine-specific restriction endonuclease McrA
MRAPLHRPPGWRPANRAPLTPDPHYQTKAYKLWRIAVLKRDGFRCTDPLCETPDRGFGGRLIADHVEKRRDGGADLVSNGRTRCPKCHNQRHAREGDYTGRR